MRGPTADSGRSSTQLPEDESQSIHIDMFERLKRFHVDSLVQNLGRHVALRALLGVRGNVHLVHVLEDGQTKVGNATRHVVLHQDVLCLHVSVGDGRLCLGPKQLRVEVSQPAAHRYGHLEHDFGGDGLLHEEVVQRPKLMVLRDEPQLCDTVVGHHVARKETQDVVVTQEQRVVDLRFATPRLFVTRKELLYGYWFALVVAEVDLAVAAVPDEIGDLDGACDGALDEEGEA